MGGSRFHLTFPERLVREPVIHTLGQRFGVVTNIRRANVDERSAWVILEIDGPGERISDALAWLAEQDVQVERLEDPG